MIFWAAPTKIVESLKLLSVATSHVYIFFFWVIGLTSSSGQTYFGWVLPFSRPIDPSAYGPNWASSSFANKN